MDSILEELLKKNKHNLNFVNITMKKKYQNKLIDLINKIFTRLDLNHIYHKDDERKYKFKQYQVLKDSDLGNLNLGI